MMQSPQDSASPEFWQMRFVKNRMPWDKSATPRDLNAYLRKNDLAGKRVLIPGCGIAYEVKAFVKEGCRVLGIDFCEDAIAKARGLPGDFSENLVRGDFFCHDFVSNRFDLIYERAFLCSIPPRLWSKWGQRINELLAPDGRLLGYFFYGPPDEEGPPFGLTVKKLKVLLGGGFIRIEDRKVEDSVAVFANYERWQVWERSRSRRVNPIHNTSG